MKTKTAEEHLKIITDWFDAGCYVDDAAQEMIQDAQEALKNAAQFKLKMPTDQQLVDIAILFNDGKVDIHKMADMVAMCQFVLDRLSENNDVMIPSTKENK